MRHRASLLASLEGISRATFLIARELSQNSRSGLTPRFLAKKLELSQEEIEYLIDVNHKLLYTDLTKIRLAPEGFHAVKRVLEGLESHGDVAALMQRIRALPDQDIQRIEERLGLSEGLPKKELFEQVLTHTYKHPDSVMNYVASHDFSACAREVFDILWQSKDGIMSVSQLYAVHGGSEYEIEQALWELLQGCACFELFRFDSEDRLMRAVALLKEVRNYRHDGDAHADAQGAKLAPVKTTVEDVCARGISFSEHICRIGAAIAARRARLRNDGELFMGDKRRLLKACNDDDEALLNTSLWVAEGLGWVARVDNTLQGGAIDEIVELSRIERHRVVCNWLTAQADVSASRTLLEQAAEEMKSGAWYRVMDFLQYAKTLVDQTDAPCLRHIGAHYEYVAPSVSGGVESRLARALEETFVWLGIVDRGWADGEPCFRVSKLGEAILLDADLQHLQEHYPDQKGDFIVQPNYEVVAAAEELDPLMTVPLETFAERVSAGRALVYRLTRESFVRAMQEGRSADGFIAFLLNYSRAPLPENVLITLKDWRGAAKQVRLRTWHVIETDDPLVIAEIEHNRRWKPCVEAIDARKALRYRDMSRAELKRALEKDGYIVK